MVVFVVNDIKLELNETDTILNVKKEIIKQLNLSCKYIDITFVMEKPMRILGKFNVEPGKVPRTFDRYTLEKFAFKDEVTIEFKEIDDYDPDKIRVPIISGGRGRGRGRGLGLSSPGPVSLDRAISQFNSSVNQQTMVVEPSFNLDSNEDFPSLC